jgi:hypothetical protein
MDEASLVTQQSDFASLLAQTALPVSVMQCNDQIIPYQTSELFEDHMKHTAGCRETMLKNSSVWWRHTPHRCGCTYPGPCSPQSPRIFGDVLHYQRIRQARTNNLKTDITVIPPLHCHQTLGCNLMIGYATGRWDSLW